MPDLGFVDCATSGRNAPTHELRCGKTAEFAFPDGQTETWLSPPAGSYKMKLELVSNELPDKVLATSEVVSIHLRDLPQ